MHEFKMLVIMTYLTYYIKGLYDNVPYYFSDSSICIQYRIFCSMLFLEFLLIFAIRLKIPENT
jgi:hypothetical protein